MDIGDQRRAISTVLVVILLPLGLCDSLNTYYFPDPCSYGVNQVVKVGGPSKGTNSSGILKLNNKQYYQPNMYCSVTLTPISSNGITLAIRNVDFRPNCTDRIKITFENGDELTYCKNVDDPKESMSVSYLGRATVTFTSSAKDIWLQNGFEIIFTSYEQGTCKNSPWFQCDNGFCISKELLCDGHNHCGDRSDQNYCGVPVGGVVGIVLGCIFLIAVIAVVVFYVLRKKKAKGHSVLGSEQQ